MHLETLVRAIMLFMSNSKPDLPMTSPGSISVATSLPTTTVESIEIQTIDPNEKKNCSDETTTNSNTALTPYDFDCSMPYPPNVIDDWDENSWGKGEDEPEVQPEMKQLESKLDEPQSKLEEPQSKVDEPQPEVEHPHAKATFSIPIHVVHKLPDSAVNDLHK